MSVSERMTIVKPWERYQAQRKQSTNQYQLTLSCPWLHILYIFPIFFPAHSPATHLATVTICISYFLRCSDEIHDQGNYRKEGFLLAHSWNEVHQSRKACWQGHETTGHIAFPARTQRAEISLFSFSLSLTPPCLWNGTSHPQSGSTHSINVV